MFGFMVVFELPQLDRNRLVIRARRVAVTQAKAVRNIAGSFAGTPLLEVGVPI